MPEERPDDLEGPAERRLDEHLELVRTNPPEAERGLAAGVVRHASWQRLMRAPLEVIATLVTSLMDALTVFAGDRRRQSESRR